MKINEVMKETGLTKKAIYYYENEGLISPAKEPRNNYRIYTDDDVRKLIRINILRRLDVPIRAIGDIINHKISIKDILKEQLILTNQRINILIQNKMIINELITKDIEDKDFSLNTLKDLDLNLDTTMVGSEYLGKELERIFPGTLGKLVAIFYNDYLNIKLDTDEKISAWYGLIEKLDGMHDINYPENIKKIVDEMYGEMEQVRLADLDKISKHAIDTQLERQITETQSILMAKEAPEPYYNDPENHKKSERYYILQDFILKNLVEFKDIGIYIGIINERYKTINQTLNDPM